MLLKSVVFSCYKLSKKPSGTGLSLYILSPILSLWILEEDLPFLLTDWKGFDGSLERIENKFGFLSCSSSIRNDLFAFLSSFLAFWNSSFAIFISSIVAQSLSEGLNQFLCALSLSFKKCRISLGIWGSLFVTFFGKMKSSSAKITSFVMLE